MSIVHIAFYPSDWLAGTRGLSAEETGVYITLIARMYEMAGPIERDDDRLSRLCGCKSRASFVKALKYLISEGKVIEIEGSLFNERVEKEIEKTTQKSSKAAAAAQSRWDRKPNKNNGSTSADASPKHMPQPCQSEPEPELKKDIAQIAFEEFWEICPRKVGKGNARPAFRKALKKATASEIIEGMRKFARVNAGADPQFIAHPATWLNGERWGDDMKPRAVSQPCSQPQRKSHVQIMKERGQIA